MRRTCRSIWAQLTLLAGIDELTSVQALSSDKGLLVGLVAVRVPELDLRDGRAPPRIVDDLLDDALDVAVALRKVEVPQLGGTLARPCVGLEDGAGGTLTLRCFNENRYNSMRFTHNAETQARVHTSKDAAHC